jgi:prepilin-type N-terminal cleavage/methylation domain-containing protein
MKKKIQKGFTLIELLVVISIISILTSIMFVAINPKSQTLKADDAKILSMLNSIQKALELHMLDKGYYPRMSAHTYHDGLNKDEFNTALQPYMPIDINDPI